MYVYCGRRVQTVGVSLGSLAVATDAVKQTVLTEALLLIRKLRSTGGGDCGLKAYEVVRFAVVSSVRGRQCSVGEGQSVPRGRGQGEKKLWRLGRGRARR